MKIIVVGLDYDEGFSRYIANEFESMGNIVARFDPSIINAEKRILNIPVGKYGRRLRDIVEPLSLFRARSEKRLFELAEEIGQVSLIVVCSDFLAPRTVEGIKRKTKAAVALWFPDPVSSFRRQMFLNAPYDALFFKDPFIVDSLKRMTSLPVFYLPEAFDSKSIYPVSLSADDRLKYECDIAIAGNYYSYRIAVLNQLADYDIKLWGKPPANWAICGNIDARFQNEFVAGLSKVKAFLGARVALNSMFISEVWGINVRAFEIAGAGGFQMVDWRPGLSQLFIDGEELVAFRSITDLKEKIQRYLPACDERAEIAAAGRRRALAEHTYGHRLQLMLDTVFSNGKGYPMPTIRNWVDG